MTQICKERFLLSKSHRPFPSKSDPSKRPYKAYAFREGELPMCTCHPFLAGRKREAAKTGSRVGEVAWTCSHLKRVFAETCDWVQEGPADYQWSHNCPKCGSDLIDTDDTDVPDDRDGQIDDLRVLLDELMQSNQPEPDEPAPTPAVKASDAASALMSAMKGSK